MVLLMPEKPGTDDLDGSSTLLLSFRLGLGEP
jgi:hypothetical protein